MNPAKGVVLDAEEIWQIYQRLERELGDSGYGSTVDYLRRNGHGEVEYEDVVKACELYRLRRDGWKRMAHHLFKLGKPSNWFSILWSLDARARGVELGRGCYCKGKLDIERHGGRIVVGKRVEFGKYVLMQTAPQGEITVGDDVQINRFNFISAGCKIEIGAHCIFAPGVSILDSEYNFRKRTVLIKNAPGISDPVKIDRGVWLGYGVSVLKGVHIGEGAVIGAHSVVKEDVPEYAIAVGAPARVIGYRE
jgi:acetyltransferase-like isoleucine patch superfamily enzyme